MCLERISSIKPPIPPAEAVLREARSWLGVRYRHQSADRTHGIDCVRLVIEVGRAIGACGEMTLPRYRRITPPRVIREQMRTALIPLAEPAIGAVVLWGTRVGVPTHFGILSDLHGGWGVIHADSQLGKVVEHGIPNEQRALLDSFWWFA
jgi:cell wall-associated NlpC family hydrolase